MQFQRLRVKNWRCFEDESVRFEDGVTVLHGNNGAGKSSLLEAAFFALYGTDALDTGTTMDDVVTTDEDTTEVTLSFTHQRESYEVTREIRVRSSTYQEANLTTPPGKPDLDQTGEIDELIQEELRLNAEDFLNSAYVRQGDVTRLIEASPSQRQQIIDNLLQMKKLERYRERMDAIETGVSRVEDTKDGQIEELTGQIEDYDEPQIRSRIQHLEGFETDLDDRRDSIDKKISELEDKKREAKDTIDRQRDLEEEVETNRDAVEDWMNDLLSDVDEYQTFRDDLSKADAKVEEARGEIETLLTAGDGELTEEHGEASAIVEEISEVAETTTHDALRTVDESAADGGEMEPAIEDDPSEAAASILDANEDDGSGTIETADDLLADLSTPVPPLSPAVTGDPADDDSVTVATAEAIDGGDIDPIINLEVSVDLDSVRVLTPGLEADPGSLEVKIAADAHEDTRDVVAAIRDQLQTLEDEMGKARSSANNSLQEAREHERNAEDAVEDASEVLSRVAAIRYARETLEQRRQEFRERLRESAFDIDPEHDRPQDLLQNLHETLDARIRRLNAEREHHNSQADMLKGQISRADELLEEGNCPRCGRPVEGAPEVEHADEWREERQNHVERAKQLDDGVEMLSERNETAEELTDRAAELFGDDQVSPVSSTGSEGPDQRVDPTSEIRPLHEEAADHHLSRRREREAAHQKRLDAVEQHVTAILLERTAERTLAHLFRALTRQNLLRQIKEATQARADAEGDRQLASSQVDNQSTEVAETHTDLQDSIESHTEATNEFDPDTLSEAKQTVEETTSKIDDLNAELDALHNTEREVSKDLGDLRTRLRQLEELRSKRDTRQREADAVSALHDQVAKLEAMFTDLRADLRQQNVERLEDLLKDMFDTLYRNDAYADIELGGDYDATLIEKGGGELPPSKLSGGESAVFNLALRGAIYRLLTEGFEDDVPMPPLILDEPTAHLDDGHVDRLDDVVDAMRTAGVEQTIVVSHDEELIDGADQRIEVRQRQGTNRSVAEPESGVTLGL